LDSVVYMTMPALKPAGSGATTTPRTLLTEPGHGAIAGPAQRTLPDGGPTREAGRGAVAQGAIGPRPEQRVAGEGAVAESASSGDPAARAAGRGAVAAGDGFDAARPPRLVDSPSPNAATGDTSRAVRVGAEGQAAAAQKLHAAVPEAKVDASKPEAYTRSTAAALDQRAHTLDAALAEAQRTGQKTIFIPPLGVREVVKPVLDGTTDPATKPNLDAVRRGMRDVRGTPEHARFEAAVARARAAGVEVVVGQDSKAGFDNRTDVLSGELGLPKRTLDWRDRALHDLYGPSSAGYAFDRGSALSTPAR